MDISIISSALSVKSKADTRAFDRTTSQASPLCPSLSLCGPSPGQHKQATFPWLKRLSVALGAAEALAFMHRNECVHRDFKAANVLLDKVWLQCDVPLVMQMTPGLVA